MALQEKLLTAEEFAAMPDDGKRHELVKGVFIEVSRPKLLHGRVQVRFASFIGRFVDEHDLGLTTTETGYVLARNPDTVRGPDVAFVSKGRLEHPDPNEYIPIAPDLAVEIVSPNDTASEIGEKLEEYLQAGTRMVWVVYPARKTVHVYHGDNKAYIIDINGILDGGDALPGFKLPLRDVFQGLGD